LCGLGCRSIQETNIARWVPAAAMIGRRFPHLLKAAAGGDEAAFRVLWHDLQLRLFRYFTVMATAAGEELAAATWMAVIGGLSRFRGSEPAFRAWVFTIARHQLGSWQRRSGGNPAEQRPVTDGVQPAAFDDPVGSLQGIPTRAALDMVATLPADQAEAITLRVVGGLGLGQVAEVMGKPPGTVRVLTHRGLQRLAERLSRDAHVPGVG
jgi:RNA polymerase sigma-70 factor, ECF subfamily